MARALQWLRSTNPQSLVLTAGQGWWHGWGYGDVTGRMVEAFVLARRVLEQSGVGPEEERTRDFLLSLFDASDGLSWRPETPFRRRAAHLFDQSSVLFGLVAWLEDAGEETPAGHLDRLVSGLCAIAEWHGGWCRYPLEVYTPSGWTAAYDEFRDGRINVPADPCHEGGRQILPLVRWHELSGSREARRLAEGLTHFVVDHSGVFEPDGSYLERHSRATGHVHSRLAAAAGVLRLGTLADRQDWVDWARTVFDWSMAHVASSFGWISERAHSMDGGCETCCLTDALDLAVGLAEDGQTQYWDLAERIVRNHLLESQCPDTGGFSGHTMPGDYCWVHPTTGQPEHHVGGCCSPAGVRALWRVWDRVVVRQEDTTFIHHSLDRHTPWATVVSALPWEGRVAVTVLQPGDLMLRIPPWVCRDTVRVSVGAAPAPITWTGPYVRVRNAAAGDCVEVCYAVPEERRAESIMGRQYEVTWRGSTVLAVEPAGPFEPLYRRQES